MSEVEQAFEDGRDSTLDVAIRMLEKEGERVAALLLRREFNHWPANHQCTMVQGQCTECGAQQ